MARRIWVSDEVYGLLLERKGGRSFSEVIMECLCREEGKSDVLGFAGALKGERRALEELKATIAKEREESCERPIK